MNTIELLQKSAYEQAVKSGWHEEERTVGDFIALMHSELSEALEAFRDGKNPKEIWWNGNGKPEGVPVELADCVIRILDFCGHHGIDLEQAIELKMKFNATRPHRHGGKAL